MNTLFHSLSQYASSRDVNTAIMELLVMAYALKTSCAKNIIGVIPYFPYSKQCKMRKRGSIVCKLLASMLAKAGKHMTNCKLLNAQLKLGSDQQRVSLYSVYSVLVLLLDLETFQSSKFDTLQQFFTSISCTATSQTVYRFPTAVKSQQFQQFGGILTSGTKTGAGVSLKCLGFKLFFLKGLTHIITMDLHQKEIQGFFGFPVDNLRASPFLIQYIQEEVTRMFCVSFSFYYLRFYSFFETRYFITKQIKITLGFSPTPVRFLITGMP